MDLFNEFFSLAGKIALVTGGASGLGRTIAETLRAAGATVIIASRKEDACIVAAEEMNSKGGPGVVIGFGADVHTESGIEQLVERVRERTDRLHILVNNAGRSWGADLEKFPYTAWNDIFSLNVTGLFTLTQRLLPELSAAASHEDPSRIINLGSIAGSVVTGSRSYSYSASKAAVHHLTRILASDLAPRRITVNALAPGVFETRMTAHMTSVPEHHERLINAVPLGRLGQQSDIAGTVLYLCGRGASHVTGAIIPIDGGRHLSPGGRA